MQTDIKVIKASIELVESGKYEIVDIRTDWEWEDTGVVKGSKLITFYDEKHNGNINPNFIDELKAKADMSKPIGLLCEVGIRTVDAAKFLTERGIDCVSLDGGIQELIDNGYKTQKYKNQ